MVGQIIKINSGFYDIISDGEIFRTRGSGNLRETLQIPLVGDHVRFEPNGFVYEILERKNFLIRPKVANIDQVIIVTALLEPKFSSYLLDKFLAIIEFQEIKPIILFTKKDLIAETICKDYISQGYQALAISNMENYSQNYSPLKKILKDKLSVFTGQSGAGKSTTINQISDLKIETQGLSKNMGRGKHTTRIVEIHLLENFKVIDTPGFSILDISLSKNDLSKSYHDFKKLSYECEFRTCIHFKEINCKIKAAVEDNIILKSRYKNYLRLISEAKDD